ncbi:hypothetical protein [Gordonia sp. NPDC003376]
MTFAIAEILADTDGRVTMLADTKVTHETDEAWNRQVYTRPMLKIVVVDDDVAVAVAGNWPQSSIQRAVGLRGRTPAEVVEALKQFSAEISREHGAPKSFLIAKRAPGPRLWRIREGEVDAADEKAPRLWIGDRAGFSAFQSVYLTEILDQPLERRLAVATQAAVAIGDVASVGGYVTRVTGSANRPFRFRSDPSGSGPWETEGRIVERDGSPVLQMRVPPGVDPSQHSRIGVPGSDHTFGAMAFYSPETKTARLWTHDTPWELPIELRGVDSLPDLVRRAAQDYGQSLASVKLINIDDCRMDAAIIREL